MSTTAKTAFIVGDLQHGIIGRLPNLDEGFLKKAASTIETSKAAGVTILQILVAFRPGYPEIAPTNKSFAAVKAMGVDNPSLLNVGDETATLHPLISAASAETIIYKRRFSAFAGSDLEMVLRSQGITHIVLAGLTTSGVVLSTLRQAADLDYEITVLSDLCADGDDEVQKVLMEKIFPMQATVTTSEAWLAGLSS